MDKTTARFLIFVFFVVCLIVGFLILCSIYGQQSSWSYCQNFRSAATNAQNFAAYFALAADSMLAAEFALAAAFILVASICIELTLHARCTSTGRYLRAHTTKLVTSYLARAHVDIPKLIPHLVQPHVGALNSTYPSRYGFHATIPDMLNICHCIR